MNLDFKPLIAKRRQRFEELEKEITDPSLFDDAKKAREVLKEHARVKELISTWDEMESCRAQLVENQELASGSDVEMAELAKAEIEEINARIPKLEQIVLVSLLPPQPDDDRDAIVEIRAGAGGSEAAIFAGDLYRMYTRYAEAAGLRYELIEASPNDAGGFKEVIFQIFGNDVFRRLRYESGVHRVQRVPATEAQGRIHTSTATVAVLPEAEEVDFELRPQDLRIEVCRSGGPGGQGVNTTDSAVQVMHIPTGKIVRCQDGRSQQKNKEKALTILRSRLLEEKREEEAQKYAAHRKSQIGSGGREEKIRTYNFPQNRLTEHRIGVTLYNLDRFMEGEIADLIAAIGAADTQQRLEASAASDSQ
ncbi:MAG: peptide chain release factor 1 [Chthoniobacterales bacterium]|jgi:peptide chain release factor 1|nr:peptide chain release factor 1 [Chthoniobacterales bacterium]